MATKKKLKEKKASAETLKKKLSKQEVQIRKLKKTISKQKKYYSDHFRAVKDAIKKTLDQAAESFKAGQSLGRS